MLKLKKIFDLFRNVLVLKEKYTPENLKSVSEFVMIPCLVDLYENGTFSGKISCEDMMNRTVKNCRFSNNLLRKNSSYML